MYNVLSCSPFVGVNYLLYKGADKNIIVDTGSPYEEIQASAPAGFVIEHVQTFEEALSKIDLEPEDIDVVILTHLHHDHYLNVFKCINADIYVQEEEVKFAIIPHKIWHGVYDSESALKLLKVKNLRLIRGDADVVEGVKILFTPGHTVGGQSVSIETNKGRIIIAGLCCLMENFFPSKSLSEKMDVVPPGIHTNVMQAYDSMIRLRKIAKHIIALHDPNTPEVLSC